MGVSQRAKDEMLLAFDVESHGEPHDAQSDDAQSDHCADPETDQVAARRRRISRADALADASDAFPYVSSHDGRANGALAVGRLDAHDRRADDDATDAGRRRRSVEQRRPDDESGVCFAVLFEPVFCFSDVGVASEQLAVVRLSDVGIADVVADAETDESAVERGRIACALYVADARSDNESVNGDADWESNAEANKGSTGRRGIACAVDVADVVSYKRSGHWCANWESDAETDESAVERGRISRSDAVPFQRTDCESVHANADGLPLRGSHDVSDSESYDFPGSGADGIAVFFSDSRSDLESVVVSNAGTVVESDDVADHPRSDELSVCASNVGAYGSADERSDEFADRASLAFALDDADGRTDWSSKLVPDDVADSVSVCFAFDSPVSGAVRVSDSRSVEEPHNVTDARSFGFTVATPN